MYTCTLLGTNISHPKAFFKMMFLFPRRDMLVAWMVYIYLFCCIYSFIYFIFTYIEWQNPDAWRLFTYYLNRKKSYCRFIGKCRYVWAPRLKKGTASLPLKNWKNIQLPFWSPIGIFFSSCLVQDWGDVRIDKWRSMCCLLIFTPLRFENL